MGLFTPKRALKVDLHMHTTCSDGHLTPTELVRAVHKAGLDIVAITDHDTTAGIEEARQAVGNTSLRIIPGIEISSHIDDFEIHVLGLNVDHTSLDFQNRLEGLRKARRERIHVIVETLNKLGIKIDADEVFALAKGKSVGRPHVARALVKKGVVASTDQAFKRFLGRTAPAYVKTYDLVPAEAFAMIRQAGGIPVLAHPAFVGDDTVIPTLIGAGLMGIEVFHRYEDESVWENYLRMAERYQLLVTGGSDFHGYDRSTKSSDLGEVTLPYEYFQKLDQAMASARAVK